MRTAFSAFGAVMLITGLALPHSGQAGPVSVTNVDGRLTVEATDAGVDEVLTRLGEVQGFQLLAPVTASRKDGISGRFEGSLDSVLSRILHNESHMIIHSANSQSGIARIVLFGLQGEATAATTAPSPAATRVVVTRSRTATAVVDQPRPLAREIISAPPQSRPVPPVPVRTRSGTN